MDCKKTRQWKLKDILSPNNNREKWMMMSPLFKEILCPDFIWPAMVTVCVTSLVKYY
ncbi:MAG: hypothetical protein ACUVRK_09670 [Spirochaetota bacterium]